MSAQSSQQVTCPQALLSNCTPDTRLPPRRLFPFLPATASYFVHLDAAAQRDRTDIFSRSALPTSFRDSSHLRFVAILQRQIRFGQAITNWTTFPVHHLSIGRTVNNWDNMHGRRSSAACPAVHGKMHKMVRHICLEHLQTYNLSG